MMKAERQELILKRVADSGRVVVTDLAKEMGVTETTLRKDLQELDDRGAVQRVHGGAIKPDTELSRFENRVDLGADVKVAGVFAHGVDDLHAFVLAGLADGIEAERVDHGFGDGVLNIEKLNGRLLFRRERLAGGNEAECVAAVFAAVDGKKNAHEGYLLFV